MSDVEELGQVAPDPIGTLRNNLTGYEPSAVVRELLQNADDACATQGVDDAWLKVEFRPDRLIASNPSVLTDLDWERVRNPNRGGKRRDASTTGEFGVGFWSVLHLTDDPTITSGSRRQVLNPVRITGHTVDPIVEGTVVELPYRTEVTELAADLEIEKLPDVDELVDSFVSQGPDLLLFTACIHRVCFVLPDGSTVEHRRDLSDLGDGVLRSSIESSDGSLVEHLVVSGDLDDPPNGRRSGVQVAFALADGDPVPGRVFCTFPTEVQSGVHLSINGHFAPTSDRRSLERSGTKGEWNDQVFVFAGSLVGSHLSPLLRWLSDGEPDRYLRAVRSFIPLAEVDATVERRADAFLEGVDEAASSQQVILDRTGLWRRGSDAVILPAELEDRIATEVGGCIGSGADDAERDVLERWGAQLWGPPEVAEWLGRYALDAPTAVGEAPMLMRDPDLVVDVLDFCGGCVGPLNRRAVLLGSDEQYHPVGAPLHKIVDDRYAEVVVGLSRPVLDRRFDRLPVSDRCRPVAAQWLREALIEDQDQLVGSRVPLSSFGVAERQARVIDALELLIGGNASIEGVPLALDPSSRLQVFDDRTVGDVPEGAYRKQIERLCERLGLRIVHKVIDETVKGKVHRFSLSVIPESQPAVADWNPLEDSPLVLDAIGALTGASPLSDVLADQLRSLPMWPTTKRKSASLAGVYLPQLEKHSVQVKLRDEQVRSELFAGEGGRERHRVMRERLGVEVLDRVEELVRSCLDGSAGATEQEGLVSLLAREQLSRAQRDRLSEGAFVPTLRAGFRSPTEVTLTTQNLPLELGDRTVSAKLCADPEVVAFLQRLGSRVTPSAFDLSATAEKIARMPLTDPLDSDPGVVLVRYLRDGNHGIDTTSLKPLASTPWLVASDGKGTRRVRPKDAIDPGRPWAYYLYPYPVRVGTFGQELRLALGMRYELSADELCRIAQAASAAGDDLPGDYFYQLERAATHVDNEAALAGLSKLKIIALGGGGVAAPDELIAPALAEIWGHLRQQIPMEYAERYPNLLRVWRVSDAIDQVGGIHHVQVLESLADRQSGAEPIPERDRRLAEARLASITSLVVAEGFDPNEVDLPLLTTAGLRSASESFRGDLPHDAIVRLGNKVPIILESTQTAGLLSRLDVRSLRREVQLEPTTSALAPDHRWDQRLAVHRTNVIRFLLHAAEVDESILEHWPPAVHKVQTLQITASLDGVVLDEWRADAFLGWESDRLVLYVQGEATASALGRAMSQVFGIAPGTNALLRGVLDSPDPVAGEELLDEDNIPPLPEGRYEYEPDIVEPQLDDDGDEAAEAAEETSSTLPPDPTWDPGEQPLGSDVEAHAENDGDEEDVSSDADRPGGERDASTGEEAEQILDALGDLPPDDLASPRGATDELDLEARGYRFTEVDDDEVPDEEWSGSSGKKAEPSPTKVCLSYYAWAHGLLPIKAGVARELAGGSEVGEVVLFGDVLTARQASADYLRIDGGHEVFVDRLVSPGTVIYLEPGAAGRIELHLEEQPHTVSDVWMLELDDDGRLIRTHLPAVEVPYETQGPVYKAERRFEDINALLAEVQAQPKSARQLIIEVFEQFGDAGLTEVEVWDLVAMHRLFARATVSRELSEQFGLFSRTDGRWYLTGNEIRRARRRPGREGSAADGDHPSAERARPPAADDLKKANQLVKQLRQLLARLPREQVLLLGRELGFAPRPKRSSDLDEAVTVVLAGDAPEVVAAVRRDLERNPEVGAAIVERLVALDARRLDRVRELIASVVELGDPASVAHARRLLDQADALNDGGDPTERAEALLVRSEAGEGLAAVDVAAAQSALAHAYKRGITLDSFETPLEAIELLVRLERLHRRLSRVAQSEQVVGARSDLLAHYLGQIGDTSAHDTEERQWCRAFVDLLAHKFVDSLDDLAELTKRWDRSPQRAGDAAQVRRLMVRFADVRHIENAVVRVAARASKGSGQVTADTRSLADQWAEMAGITSKV